MHDVCSTNGVSYGAIVGIAVGSSITAIAVVVALIVLRSRNAGEVEKMNAAVVEDTKA